MHAPSLVLGIAVGPNRIEDSFNGIWRKRRQNHLIVRASRWLATACLLLTAARSNIICLLP